MESRNIPKKWLALLIIVGIAGLFAVNYLPKNNEKITAVAQYQNSNPNLKSSVPLNQIQSLTTPPSLVARLALARLALVPKVFLMGGHDDFTSTESNNVIVSNDGVSWNQITNSALWQPRAYHTSVSFQKKLWVLGGLRTFGAPGGYDEFNDVYSSPNGVTWTQVNGNAPWSKREGHTSVVFNGKIWVIGGSHFQPPAGPRINYSDVWSSPDGINWTQVTANASWGYRQSHTSVVFNNKIWVIGGSRQITQGGTSYVAMADVWSSSDGVNWVQVNANAPFGDRQIHASAVFNGKMYVLGGAHAGTWANDVWSSPDGINWTQVTGNAAWPRRGFHVAFVFKNKIWIAAGAEYTPPNTTLLYKDVWSSLDGVTWTQQTMTFPNLYHERPTVVVLP